MKLTARAVSAARFDGKPVKLYDGHGLYLHVTATAKTWRYGFRLAGKQRIYTIGPLDLITLSEAREKHREARKLVVDGIDPVAQRKAEKTVTEAPVVGDVVDAWFARKRQVTAESNSEKIKSRLKHLRPAFRGMEVTQVEPSDMIAELLAMSDRRSADLAHRVLGYLRSAFDELVADDVIKVNPARHPTVETKMPVRRAQKRYAHTTKPDVLADVLRKIELYIGEDTTTTAMWLTPRLFCRPGELRNLRWSDINFNDRQIEIDGSRMKAGRDFIIPLASQCLERFRQLHDDRRSDVVFYSPLSVNRPISDMTISTGLVRVGVSKSVIVPHGFRHTASTFLNERQFVVDGDLVRFRPDVIEAQLAHVQTGVRGRYNRSEYIDERRVMMQAWADWLDEIAS